MRLRFKQQKLTLILTMLVCTLAVFCFPINKASATITKAGDYDTYSYTGGIQTFTAPLTGYYQLETWGASGGGDSGDGTYATGAIYLTKGETLYVVVGGTGSTTKVKGTTISGGYNGGGSATNTDGSIIGSGGGATHIATVSGILSQLSGNRNAILIVSSGSGGGYTEYATTFPYINTTRDGYIYLESTGSGGGLNADNIYAYIYILIEIKFQHTIVKYIQT